MNIKQIMHRIARIASGRKGIYGEIGNGNHFSEGVLIYEGARIGRYNYFAPYTVVNNAVINNYCSIGPGCRIGLGEHDLSAISMRPIIANGNGDMVLFDLDNPTIIGCDVWLGANVIVKQGVTIGNGAVVGANSLVLKDVPAYAIVYGSPAKISRYRFDSERIMQIEASKWFENDPDTARKIVRTISGETKQ